MIDFNLIVEVSRVLIYLTSSWALLCHYCIDMQYFFPVMSFSFLVPLNSWILF